MAESVDQTVITDEVETSTTENKEGMKDAQHGEAETKETKETGAKKSAKTYTDEEVNKIVSKRIAKERAKMQKLLNGEEQESELDIRERNVLKRELTLDAKERLVNDGLPMSLADILNYEDADTFEESYKEVIKIFQDALMGEAKRRFAGTTPKATSGGHVDEIGKVFAPKAR